MNDTLSSAFNAYRRYRAAKAQSKLYRTVRYLFFSLAAAYILLLCFPQVLFAHQVTYKNFTVYSRQPLDQNVYAMLDKVEARLATSEINNTQVRPKIFLTNSQQLYCALSLGFRPLGVGAQGSQQPIVPFTAMQGTGSVWVERLLGGRCLSTALAKAPTSRRTPGTRSTQADPVLRGRKVLAWVGRLG